MRKIIEIDADEIRRCLDYDPDTGIFRWKSPYSKNTKIGSIAGVKTMYGYWQISINRIAYRANRLAFVYYYGFNPEIVDHINGDRCDNRIKNLRSVTESMNNQNRKIAKRTATGKLLGAFYKKERGYWTSSIMREGKREYLGIFQSEQDAHDAYVKRKRILHEAGTL